MGDIARLLGDLAGGRLTAAVPLLDLFRERGMEWEVARLKETVTVLLEAYEKEFLTRSRSSDLNTNYRHRAGLAASLCVRNHFWHLLADRSARLAEVEAWLAGPGEPQPEGQGGGRPLDGDRLAELWRTMPYPAGGWPTPGG